MTRMWTRWPLLPFVAVVGLVGCATIPAGPSEMVLPEQGKPFEQFQAEDAGCRQWASTQVGTTPGQAWTESTLSSAAIATLLGAALGAAFGAASGDAGIGAAIGAGSGALGGTMVGVGAGQAAAGTVQSRYDVAYQQCMYAKGNQIPMRGTVQPRYGASPPPPPPGSSSLPSSPPPPPPPR
jgi:OmpA family protein